MRKFAIIIGCLLALCLRAENYPYQSNVLWVTTPDHADWLYETGEQATVTVSLYEYGILQDGVEIRYEVGQELFPAEERGTVTLRGGKAVIPVGTMRRPGFRDCRMEATLHGRTYRHHIKLGFSPERLAPYVKDPDNFDDFWAGAMEEAARCPMQAETEYVEEYSSDKVDCYLVRLQCYRKGQHVYGYLTLPKAEGKYPVVFSPPGAGIKPMNPMKTIFYAEQGCIRFDMEIHGIRPDLPADDYRAVSAAFGTKENSYLVNGLDDRDAYYMKNVDLACVRAIDYLTALPQWDGKNVIAQGGSQGGALALVTAALDKRVTACVANHPALSDMAGYKDGRAGGYPHLFTKFRGMDTPEKLRTLEYYDVVNFARRITVPVYMTWGYNDNTCPPTTSYIVYNVLRCPKEALITPVNEHWVSTDTRHDQLRWIKQHLLPQAAGGGK